MSEDFDVVIVGSGFGGSVAALRLSEKGYRVCVLEAGRRFEAGQLPKTSWRLKSFLWAPKLKMFGIQRLHVLPNVVVLAGAGVGGGSLVYANTLYQPPAKFFEDEQWRGITDWQAELAPYYDQASRMLGVTQNPLMTPSDDAMLQTARDLGVGDTFRLAPVGVYFGDGPGKRKADPFFGGVGPERVGCLQCGSCMTGCRHGAKNDLTKNYLALAEIAGASVIPLSTVTSISPLPAGGFELTVTKTGSWLPGRDRYQIKAPKVVIAAGTYGTQKLLHRMRAEGKLPKISARLGTLSRSNSESLVGAYANSESVDYTQGVAITSSFFPNEHTHVEPVRYGRGSNLMALLSTVLTEESPGVPRWRTWLSVAVRHPLRVLSHLWVKGWSERAVIALVMQNVDNSLTVYPKRNALTGKIKLTSKQGEGQPNPSYIPEANQTAKQLAKVIDGRPVGNLGDLISSPITAHFVGGAVISSSPESGVVDPYQRLWGYPDITISDGSVIPANLGVNPSLTITALAERVFSLWPNKGEIDVRPPQGDQYRALEAIPPIKPVVPAHAVGALRVSRG